MFHLRLFGIACTLIPSSRDREATGVIEIRRTAAYFREDARV